MKECLEAKNLSAGYDGKALLEQVTLSVRRGEIAVLIGPNGAGKSTLLKTLARQLAPVAGAVYLDGRAIHQLSGQEMARRLAIVTTERISPELMTCADVVRTGRYPYTGRFGLLSGADEAIAAAALASVHGEDLADRPFACISDGQRQRVLLARALCQQPEVIVLDEPTSFLDIRHKIEMLEILRRLVKEQQLAVVMSLHELDLAQRIADTVICIQEGGMGRIGTPEQVFDADYIRSLYQLEKGSYDPLFGGTELEAVKGTPRVFVIGGGGSGIPLYRKLQRQGVPFGAGILPRNDLDYPVAKALAAALVEVPPYQLAGEADLARARGVHSGGLRPLQRLLRPPVGAGRGQAGRLAHPLSQTRQNKHRPGAFLLKGSRPVLGVQQTPRPARRPLTRQPGLWYNVAKLLERRAYP